MVSCFFIRQVGRRINEVKVSNCTAMSIGELNDNDCKGSCNKGIIRWSYDSLIKAFFLERFFQAL